MFSLKQRVMSELVFPLYHIMKRDGLLAAIKNLEKSQWKSREELLSIQNKKLSKLLVHSEKNVPYYHKLFKSAGLTCSQQVSNKSFRKLPVLTKALINNNREDLVAVNINRDQTIKNTTSGSTGESLVFYNDKRSFLQRQAVVLRNQKWVDAYYSDREVRLWGAQMDLDKLTSWHSKLHSVLTSTVHLSTYDLSDDSMREYVKIINRFQPKLLISYPSPLAEFSRYIVDNNITIHPIRSIITSAEKLYDWQRDLINEAFQSEVFDRYGCREFGNIAHECSSHEGYHVNDERFLLEILDDNGVPVKQGEIGKIHVTDLDNFAFPFIRYEIGDMAVRSDSQCSCGRGLSLLQRIEGRSFDVIKCPNGNRVAGTFWTICLRLYSGVIKFQVIQNETDQLLIKLVIDSAYQKSNESKMKSEIVDKCGKEMNISFDYVDDIELTKSGKQKLVINNVSGH